MYFCSGIGTLRAMSYRRHNKPLMLTDDERRTLEQWARRPKTTQRLALRARVVLACAEGETNRWSSQDLVETLPALTA